MNTLYLPEHCCHILIILGAALHVPILPVQQHHRLHLLLAAEPLLGVRLVTNYYWVLSEELILYRVDGAKYFLCRQNLIELKSCFEASAYLCSCESDL